MSIEFRDAKLDEKERDEIVTLLKYAYDEPPPALEHFKKWWEVIYKEHYIGALNGEIVTSLRSIPFDQNVRGVFKKSAGVGMVATYPEVRRKGYTRDLMKYAFVKMKDQGILTSSLTPFKDSYYMQFGYVNAKPAQFIELNPIWFRRWSKMPKGYSIKRLQVMDGAEELRQCQEYVVSKFNGGVKRPDVRWEELTKGNPSWLVLVYNSKKKLEGAMTYGISGYGFKIFGDDNVGRINRIRFYPKTLAAKHALYHFVYLHAEQLVKAAFPILPHDTNFESWIMDHLKTEIKQHIISMVRIINVDTVFDEISVPDVDYEQYNEEISFEVQDPICEWNNGILKLWERDGKLQSKFFPNESLDTKITIDGLSALLYGTMTIEEVEYFGWAKNLPKTDIDVLDSWFPRREYYCTEFF